MEVAFIIGAVFIGFCLGNAFQCWLREKDQ